jgi:hypothetical protein
MHPFSIGVVSHSDAPNVDVDYKLHHQEELSEEDTDNPFLFRVGKGIKRRVGAV